MGKKLRCGGCKLCIILPPWTFHIEMNNVETCLTNNSARCMNVVEPMFHIVLYKSSGEMCVHMWNSSVFHHECMLLHTSYIRPYTNWYSTNRMRPLHLPHMYAHLSRTPIQHYTNHWFYYNHTYSVVDH
jgi:hypothetical protein